MNAWKMMDAVMKCAKENNIPFILYTMEGNISYHPELVELTKSIKEESAKEDEPKKEYVVTFESIARLYLYV